MTTILTADQKQYIVDNWSKPYSEMIKHVGGTIDQIKAQVKEWRLTEPELFPAKWGLSRLIPADQTTWRMLNGELREYHRTPKGWRPINKLKGQQRVIIKPDYVLTEIKKKTPIQIARELNVNPSSVKHVISKLRKEGHDIPLRRKKKKEKLAKPINRNMVLKTKLVSSKKTRPAKKQQKKEVTRLPTRKQDLSNKKAIYIPELRMKVYVNQDADENAIRAKYLKNRIAI